MAIEDDIEKLAEIQLFAKLTEEQLKIVAFSAEHVEFEKGQYLYRKGDKSLATFVILEGDAEIIAGSDGKSVEIIPVLPGAFAGEIAMLTESLREVSLRAADDLKVLKITRDLLMRMAGDFPEIGVAMMEVLEGRLDDTFDELIDIQRELNADIR